MILQKYKLCHDQSCTSVFLSATTTAQNRQSGSGEHTVNDDSCERELLHGFFFKFFN